MRAYGSSRCATARCAIHRKRLRRRVVNRDEIDGTQLALLLASTFKISGWAFGRPAARALLGVRPRRPHSIARSTRDMRCGSRPRAALLLLALAHAAHGCGVSVDSGDPPRDRDLEIASAHALEAPARDVEPAPSEPSTLVPAALPPLSVSPRIDAFGYAVCWLADPHTVRCREGESQRFTYDSREPLAGLDLSAQRLCVWGLAGPARCWRMSRRTTTPIGAPVSHGRDVVQLAQDDSGFSLCWRERSGEMVCRGDDAGRELRTPVDYLAHSCVIADGVVRCRGNADGGRLGPGCSSSHCDEWVDVPIPDRVIAVATTIQGGCALAVNRTELHCWGGVVGDTSLCHPDSSRIMPPADAIRRHRLPGSVEALRSVGVNVCAVLTDGDVHCLTTLGVTIPSSVLVDREPRRVLGEVADIGQTSLARTCAILRSGEVRCNASLDDVGFDLAAAID